jgi:hypothetical protein
LAIFIGAAAACKVVKTDVRFVAMTRRQQFGNIFDRPRRIAIEVRR